MKVFKVNPGRVIITKLDDGSVEYTYSLEYVIDAGTVTHTSTQAFTTAAAAKQAMREKVAHERKRHCV